MSINVTSKIVNSALNYKESGIKSVLDASK